MSKDQGRASTNGRILELLGRGARTVNELAQRLGLTDNAVRAQLQRLEHDDLVRQSGWQPGVRRPHALYELTAKAHALFPKLYEPVLRVLADVLAVKLSSRRMRELFSEAGRKLLADSVGEVRGRNPHQRLVQIVSRLNGSNAGVELQRREGKIQVSACSCPLASVTARHPELCQVVAGLVGKMIGAPVREKCDRRGSPRCCFEVSE